MRSKFALFLFVAFASLLTQLAHAQVIVIANPSIRASTVSKAELSDVFTGSTSSLRDGSRVSPVLLKGGADQVAFLNEFIGKSDAAFRAGWRSLVFSGQGAMPKTIESEAALVDYIAATPGAIGYIGKSTVHDRVKILAVK
jgi:ABC-type phosphate transport system substrate-binding protein